MTKEYKKLSDGRILDDPNIINSYTIQFTTFLNNDDVCGTDYLVSVEQQYKGKFLIELELDELYELIKLNQDNWEELS